MSDNKKNLDFNQDYKYGFRTETKSVMKTKRGLSESVVREISEIKGEPETIPTSRMVAIFGRGDVKNGLIEHFGQKPLVL